MSLIRHAARVSTLALCLQAAFGAMAAEPAKPAAKAVQKAAKRYTIEQFMATTTVTGASFSKDEKTILFNSNESGIFNAYTIPVAGGKPVPLTKSTTDSTYAVDFFYNDDRILFTRDKGGDENNHLFVREVDGTEKDLTPGDKLKASFAGWRPDGGAFYVTTNERDAKVFDLYRYDAKTYQRTMLYENTSGMNPSMISDDEKWIAMTKPITTSDSEVYLYDVAAKTAKNITPHTVPATYRAASFDRQSRRLFFTSNAGGEFTTLYTYNLASGATAEHEKADWDVVGTGFSRDGRFRLSAVNQDGSIVVRVVEGADEKPVVLPKLPGGEMRQTTFSPSGRLLAFYINGDRSPNNLYVHDFRTKQTKQLTQSLNKEINPDDLVEAEVVRFKSFDGMVVQSSQVKESPQNIVEKAMNSLTFKF